MKFEFAVDKIKDGSMVRREDWKNKSLSMDKKSGVVLQINGNGESCGAWIPNVGDLAANDWETVGEAEKVTLEDFSTAELLSELKRRKAIHIEYDCLSEESFIFGKYDGKIR